MANLQLLNNINHQNLRVDTQKSENYGDAVGGCLVFPEEFISAHRDYPILLQKDPDSGDFQFIVLFGFQKNENLFLSEAGWADAYIPALMNKEPFLIGFQNDRSNPEQVTPVIHIDLDSPRVSDGQKGEALFLENGGNSTYLEEVRDNLMLIHKGITTARQLIALLEEKNLIEQFLLDIVFQDGSQLKTEAYYTISQERLGALSDAEIGEMHRQGALQLVYMMLASLGNIKALIKKHESLK